MNRQSDAARNLLELLEEGMDAHLGGRALEQDQKRMSYGELRRS